MKINIENCLEIGIRVSIFALAIRKGCIHIAEWSSGSSLGS